MKIKEILNQIKKEHILYEERGKAIKDQIIKLWSDRYDPDTALQRLAWFDTVARDFKAVIRYSEVDPETNQTVERTRIHPIIGKLMIIYGIEEKYIKDPTKYNGEQIEFLYNEYTYTKIKDQTIDIWSTNPEANPKQPNKIDYSINQVKVNASKNLWYDNTTAMINEDGFRVYNIDKQITAMNFGHYVDILHPRSKYALDEPYSFPGTRWCTTTPSADQSYYSSQRLNRSFYFVIDESKDPQNFTGPNGRPQQKLNDTSIGSPHPESYFYLGALQAYQNGTYALTGIHNPGSPTLSWDQIIAIYPKLANHKDKFVYQKLQKDEMLDTRNVMNRITEDENSTYSFHRLPSSLQLAYINTSFGLGEFPALTKAISWRYMQDDSRVSYIEKLSKNNYKERFSTFELLSEIKKDPKSTKLLNWTLKSRGLELTVEKIMFDFIFKRNQFEVYRRSKKNPNIEILFSVSQRKYCIFDANTIKNISTFSESTRSIFYKKNGVTYDVNYTRKDGEMLTSQNGDIYLAENFVIDGGSDSDPRNFYTIIELKEDMYKEQESYFFSQKQYEKLIKTYFEGIDDDDEDIETLDTTTNQPDGENQPDQETQVQKIDKKEKGDRDLPSFSDLFELENYDNKE